MNVIQQLYADPLVHSIGWTLLHACWQIVLVALVLRVVIGLLERYSANLAYGISISSLLLITIWSGWTFLNQYDYFDQAIQLAPLEIAYEVETSALVTTEAGQLLEQVEAPVFDTGWEQQFYNLEYYLPLLVLLWLAGASFLTLRFIRGWLRVRQLRRKGLRAIDADWLTKFEILKEKMKLSKPIRFSFSTMVEEPITIGYFKPIILMPLSMFTQLEPAMIEAVVLHELAHIKRSDFLINILQSLLEIIFFFHPGIWWISKKIRQTREHACDDLAVRACQDPLLYANTLTQIQFSYLTTKNDLAMSATGKTGDFTTRIKRLFGYSESPVNRKKSIAFSSIVFTSLLAFAFIKPFGELQENTIFLEQLESTNAMLFVVKPSTTLKELDKIQATFARENVQFEYSKISFTPFGLIDNIKCEFVMPDKSILAFEVGKLKHITIGLDWENEKPLDVRFEGQRLTFDPQDKGLAGLRKPYTNSLDIPTYIGALGFERNKDTNAERLVFNEKLNRTPTLFLNGKEISKPDLLLKKLSPREVLAIVKITPQQLKNRIGNENADGAYDIYANLDADGNKRDFFRKDNNPLTQHKFKVLYKAETRDLEGTSGILKVKGGSLSISSDNCEDDNKALHIFNDQIMEVPDGHCYPPTIRALTVVDSFFIIDGALAKEKYGTGDEGNAYVYYYKYQPTEGIVQELASEEEKMNFDIIQMNDMKLKNITGVEKFPLLFLNDEKLELISSVEWPERLSTIEKFDSLIIVRGETAIERYGEEAWLFYHDHEKPQFPMVQEQQLPNKKESWLLRESFTVTPNPVRETARIEFILQEAVQVQLTVLDNHGRVVRTIAEQQLDRGRQAFDWTPGHMAKGIYYVKLVAAGTVYTKSIIVQ